MKKAFLFGAMGMIAVLVIVFLFANYGQAGLTDTKTSLDIAKGTNLTIGTKEVVYNKIWETYKPIEVKSATDEVLFKGAIVEHTAQCGSECHSVVEIYKEKDGILIDDLYLNDESGNRLNIKPNIEISNSYKDVEVIDYKEECVKTESKNGTILNDCKQVQIGSHIVKEPIYEKYILGSSVKSGNYLIKPSATFNLNGWESKTYDWIMVVDGKTLSEWATWDAGLNDDLKYYYSFEGTGNTIVDSIINKNMTNSGATAGATGIVGNAYDFDGTNDYMYLTGASITAGARSFSLWFKWDDTDAGSEIRIFHATNPSDSPNIGLGATDNLNFYSPGSVGVNGNVTTAGNWYHYVNTINSTGYVRGYLNGYQIYTDTSATVTETTAWEVGGQSPNYGWFDGIIDELGIWTRELTAEEILQLYNGGNGISYTIDRDCVFNGSVKTNTGVAVNGARVVITNVNTDTVVSNTTTDANGLWNKNVTVSGNYSVYAYIPNNKTGGGDIKTYVECIRPIA